MPVFHQQDNKPLAMMAICGGVALASLQDALVKWISGSYPVHEVVVIRSVIAMPVVYLMIVWQGNAGPLFPPHWRRSVVRGLILCTAYLAFVLSLAAMPIADSVAIYFTMPFFVAGLAFPVLGERVSFHRWLAIIAGFIGVTIMLKPGRGVFEPAALFALYSAFGYAFGQMLGRDIGRHVGPRIMALHQNMVYLAVAIALSATAYAFDFTWLTHKSLIFLLRPWTMPKGGDLLLMCSLGVCGSLSMVLFGAAYKLAESSFVAPFEYTSMMWAILYGLVLFGDVPGSATILGGAVVVTAGLYMLYADRRRDRKALAGETSLRARTGTS